jgi:hypothetical protein
MRSVLGHPETRDKHDKDDFQLSMLRGLGGLAALPLQRLP